MPVSQSARDTPTVPANGFIGRQQELAEVERLPAGARLLTITGSGGCGKTRLARQVADRQSKGLTASWRP